MKWLAEKGLNVVGCDIAGKAAELFFNENQIPFRECKKITVGYTRLYYETAGIMSSRCMTVTGILIISITITIVHLRQQNGINIVNLKINLLLILSC